jgi:hypothetical protein
MMKCRMSCWQMLNQLWNIDWVDECYTNYEMLIKLLMKLSCWRMLNQLWNVDWVVDEC